MKETTVIANIAPKPSPHRITVGMNAKHTKSRHSDCIDRFVVLKFKVLEIEEEAKRSGQRRGLVAVLQEIVVTHTCRGHNQYACKRTDDGQQGHPSPQSPAGEERYRVKPDVSGNDVQNHEPKHIVAFYHNKGQRCPHREHAQQKEHQIAMLLFIHCMNEQVEKGNEEVEYQKTRGKPRRQAHEWHQRPGCFLEMKRLISAHDKGQVDHHIIKHDLQKKFDEFSGCDAGCAHEVSRDEDKAVDPDLAPATEKQQE